MKSLTLIAIALLISLRTAAAFSAAIPKLEATFDLPQVQGNPFDYLQNDVQVTFVAPDNKITTVPAFFDGGTTWRARHRPDAPGLWRVGSVSHNGGNAAPQHLQLHGATVTATDEPGFIRLNPKDRLRFTFDDGSPHYPIGYNLAWRYPRTMPPLTDSLALMGKAGVNWTRIWMNHWDGKNLDWVADRSAQPALGQLSLSVAKTWDDILSAAEQNSVYLQLVLQHHGQFSTTADTNWHLNPWNKANGGWLDSPVQFFTDPKAIALTKAKYRYILARWGYSTAILAWELFNEVENTDAFSKDLPAVAAWHADMARFIRQHDPYKHLITTSSRTTESSLWPEMDYYQSHVYPQDLFAAVQSLDSEQPDRAYFYGEIGGGSSSDPADVLHRALWASLMSASSGTAQYWNWDIVEPKGLLSHFTAAQHFLKQSGILNQSTRLTPIDVLAETPNRVPLRFGPAFGWAAARSTEFTVKPTGTVDGLGGMSAYLQGAGTNRHMFPAAQFNVTYPAAGTFAVSVDEITVDGARLQLSLDGHPAATLTLGPTPPLPHRGPNTGPARERPRNLPLNASLEIPVPAGPHTLRLENIGPDWVRLREFVLSPYTSELGVRAKGTRDAAVIWVYRRDHSITSPPVSATLTVPGLAKGTYRITWWDTYDGKPLTDQVEKSGSDGTLKLTTPGITRDLAAWITPVHPAPVPPLLAAPSPQIQNK